MSILEQEKKPISKIKRGRRYSAFAKMCVSTPILLKDALSIVEKAPVARFDETVDVGVRLGIDPKRSDQSVRGVCVLPNPIVRPMRVAVFAPPSMHENLKKEGADLVGEKDLVEAVRAGNIDFDRCLAHPSVMKLVGTVGRILAPKGLMPNSRAGTVSEDIVGALKAVRQGTTEFRTDKAGNIYVPIGKKSFGSQKLAQNLHAFIDELIRMKPTGLKRPYFLSIFIGTTMGPSLLLEHDPLVSIGRKKLKSA